MTNNRVPEDEREFLTLEELKPRQLTELEAVTNNAVAAGGGSLLNRGVETLQAQANGHGGGVGGFGGGVNVVSNSDSHNNSTNGHYHSNTSSSDGHLLQTTTNRNSGNHQQQQIYYDLNTQQTTTNGSAGNSIAPHYHYLDAEPVTPMNANWSLQPLYHHHHHHHHHHSNMIPIQATAATVVPQHHLHHHPEIEAAITLSSSTAASADVTAASVRVGGSIPGGGGGGGTRKRKCSFTETSDFDDDGDAKSVRTNDDNKKQNHSEIEKRRRDKMNTYITELSSMVPMCHAMSRKLDKLTVLRMAVQHLKTIRGAVHSYTEGHYKPAFLSDQELKMLILQAAEGFLFVVGCDRGRILYVSESVSHVLNYTQGDLLGQSWFDILDPRDVAKVKEQMDVSPRDRLIDAKTMLPVKTDIPQGLSRLCPGARRSFFCRMKCKNYVHIKEEADASQPANGMQSAGPKDTPKRKGKVNADKRYCVIQCTGYLKSWAPAKIGLEEQENEGDGESCNYLSCLVAVGRIPPNVLASSKPTTASPGVNLRPIQFMSRHAMDGKFLFVDQRATLVLGYLPQELLGTSIYEYYHPDDIASLAETHKAVLRPGNPGNITTSVYRLRVKGGTYVRVQSEWKSFKNPFTKEAEFLIAKNSIILNESKVEEGSDMLNLDNGMSSSAEIGLESSNFEFLSQNNGRESMQRLINVEASMIGLQIADEALEYHKRYGEASSGSSPDLDGADHLPGHHNSTPIDQSHSSSSNHSLALDEQRNSNSNSSIIPSDSNGHLAASHSQDATANGQAVFMQSDNSTQSTAVPRPNGITLPGYNVLRNGPESRLQSDSGFSSIDGNSGTTTTTDGVVSAVTGSFEETVPALEATNQNGNDEAAMAVIMSLLEADAGLGGPVDFTGLPWPLP